jgi:hypothetical protein
VSATRKDQILNFESNGQNIHALDLIQFALRHGDRTSKIPKDLTMTDQDKKFDVSLTGLLEGRDAQEYLPEKEINSVESL